jgi:HprK-related kinase A
MTVGSLAPASVQERLSGDGLALRIAPVTVRVRSSLRVFSEHLRSLYRDYPLADVADFADVDIRMVPVASWRRFARRQVQFIVDGVTPFDPFPIDHALPMFEWGLNWVFAHRWNDHLLLHAAVVDRGGRGLVFPAWPGSGKSTLAASLACRGWRLLSDEFGVVALSSSEVIPFARPVALKNESIEVIRAIDLAGSIGPLFPKTRKGTVAHYRAPTPSIRSGTEPTRIAALVFPDFERGATVSIRPLPKSTAFLKLAGNSFNYEVIGESAFRAVTSIVRGCESFVLRYGDLDSAHKAIEDILAGARS